MAGVLVFCEVKDGKLKKVSREALTIGRALAEKVGGALAAFASDATVAAEAGKYGAKKIYVADIGPYLTETYAGALQSAVEKDGPAVLLFGGT